MTPRRALRVLAATAFAFATAPAFAMSCYMIVDRNNNVVFQGTSSPVDLSDEGAPARDAMRSRGEQMIAMDTERCPSIDAGSGTAKGTPATVEEIVAAMRPALRFGSAAPAASASGGINLPQISVPRDSGGGISTSGIPVGMSVR